MFEHLLNQGKEVYGINRSAPKPKYMWPWSNDYDLTNNWFVYHIVDQLDEIINVLDSIRPNVVIDFMGQGMVAQSWDDPALWFNTNITKKSSLIKHLSQCDYLEQYIRASTPEIYGSSVNPRDPLSPLNPTTPYAISHASIDSYIRCLGTSYSFPFKLARFSNFYGVGQQLYRVIPRMILSCLTGKKFILDGGGTSVRSFINSLDICSAFDKMVHEAPLFSEYNFSGSEEVSISNLIDQICILCDVSRDSIVEMGPERIGKDFCYRLNCSQSHYDLDWSPEVTLEKGLTTMIKWMSSNIEPSQNKIGPIYTKDNL